MRHPALESGLDRMHAAGGKVWNALIRTHHITSRKKVAKLKQAAAKHDVFVLLRSGGSPGIMYVEGGQKEVGGWVAVVRNLRYKDYELAAHPNEVGREDFGEQMQQRGVLAWWRRGMGYAAQPERL